MCSFVLRLTFPINTVKPTLK